MMDAPYRVERSVRRFDDSSTYMCSFDIHRTGEGVVGTIGSPELAYRIVELLNDQQHRRTNACLHLSTEPR
jgi:hypothetical protein